MGQEEQPQAGPSSSSSSPIPSTSDTCSGGGERRIPDLDSHLRTIILGLQGASGEKVPWTLPPKTKAQLVAKAEEHLTIFPELKPRKEKVNVKECWTPETTTKPLPPTQPPFIPEKREASGGDTSTSALRRLAPHSTISMLNWPQRNIPWWSTPPDPSSDSKPILEEGEEGGGKKRTYLPDKRTINIFLLGVLTGVLVMFFLSTVIDIGRKLDRELGAAAAGLVAKNPPHGRQNETQSEMRDDDNKGARKGRSFKVTTPTPINPGNVAKTMSPPINGIPSSPEFGGKGRAFGGKGQGEKGANKGTSTTTPTHIRSTTSTSATGYWESSTGKLADKDPMQSPTGEMTMTPPTVAADKDPMQSPPGEMTMTTPTVATDKDPMQSPPREMTMTTPTVAADKDPMQSPPGEMTMTTPTVAAHKDPMQSLPGEMTMTTPTEAAAENEHVATTEFHNTEGSLVQVTETRHEAQLTTQGTTEHDEQLTTEAAPTTNSEIDLTTTTTTETQPEATTAIEHQQEFDVTESQKVAAAVTAVSQVDPVVEVTSDPEVYTTEDIESQQQLLVTTSSPTEPEAVTNTHNEYKQEARNSSSDQEPLLTTTQSQQLTASSNTDPEMTTKLVATTLESQVEHVLTTEAQQFTTESNNDPEMTTRSHIHGESQEQSGSMTESHKEHEGTESQDESESTTQSQPAEESQNESKVVTKSQTEQEFTTASQNVPEITTKTPMEHVGSPEQPDIDTTTQSHMDYATNASQNEPALTTESQMEHVDSPEQANTATPHSQSYVEHEEVTESAALNTQPQNEQEIQGSQHESAQSQMEQVGTSTTQSSPAPTTQLYATTESLKDDSQQEAGFIIITTTTPEFHKGPVATTTTEIKHHITTQSSQDQEGPQVKTDLYVVTTQSGVTTQFQNQATKPSIEVTTIPAQSQAKDNDTPQPKEVEEEDFDMEEATSPPTDTAASDLSGPNFYAKRKKRKGFWDRLWEKVKEVVNKVIRAGN